MTSEPTIFTANTENSDVATNAGFSMVDILTLSPRQQQIINWIMRQREATLEAIATYIEAELEDTRLEVTDLISQGFIETRESQGITYYEIDFRRQQITDRLEAMSSASPVIRPLSIILNPSGTVSIATGESFELCVTITNQGDRSAVISVAIDQDSSSIYPWCPFPSESLALSVGESCEVVFQIQVPPTAPPNDYNYTLIIDAPQHYPEHTPLQYKGRVIVQPAIQEVIRVNDPTFVTLPRTASDNPHQMRSGEIWQVMIAVVNRSERVDRFRVTVPDLNPKWFSIYYPEGLALTGIVEAAEGLPLNPDNQGQITIIFKPPVDVWAGIYAPTIRVHSANNPELALLDIAYFEVLPTYQLDVQLVTLLTRVDRQPSIYEMRLRSSGNTTRELTLKATSPEQEDLLVYTLIPEEVKIAPFGMARINIEVVPTKKCQPRFLGDRYLSFVIEVEDKQDAFLPNDRYPSNLLLAPRPWWQFGLLLIGILGLIGTLIFLIWWIFFRQPDVPQVFEFTSESSTYQESANEAIRLRWRITYPALLKEVAIEGQSSGGDVLSQPVTYNFSKGIPPELKEYCIIDRELLCQNVPTDARKPSEYVFQIKLVSQSSRTIAPVKSAKILVKPIPQAEILEFATTKPLYTESKPVLPVFSPAPVTNAIANPESAKSPPPPNPENITKVTDAPAIANLPLQQILLSTLGITKFGNNLSLNKPKPDLDNEVRLNWRIGNVSQVKEIRIVGRTPEGEIKSPPLQFVMAEGLPRSLRPYCTIADNQMICKNVPTEATASGNYEFEMAIAPTSPAADLKADPKAVRSTRKTELTKIAPYPAKILELKVNGQEALPQYSFNLNPNVPTVLTLTWKIEASAAAKIDLLPAPGNIAAVGQLALPLSPKSAEVTYTLKVTNPDGQSIMRSFIVQTIAPPPAPKSDEPPPILAPDLAVPEIDSPLIPASPNRQGSTLTPSEVPPSQK